jgi:antitoxin (DNA-binding transcriptional repressor) of toxin-antitoxin stability system
MKTATVRQIRNSFPTVLRMLKNGESVAITSRRKVVATLSLPPKPKQTKRAWADLETRFSGPPNDALDMAALISDDRDR